MTYHADVQEVMEACKQAEFIGFCNKLAGFVVIDHQGRPVATDDSESGPEVIYVSDDPGCTFRGAVLNYSMAQGLGCDRETDALING